jgi:hypothetical protein
LDDRTALPTPKAGDHPGDRRPSRSDERVDGGESVDFASRRAARGKMQLWLTAFTAAAALAVLAVVSMSVLHAG